MGVSPADGRDGTSCYFRLVPVAGASTAGPWIPLGAAAVTGIFAIVAAIVGRARRSRIAVKVIRGPDHLPWRERKTTPVHEVRLQLWNNGIHQQAFSKSRMYLRPFPVGRRQRPPRSPSRGDASPFHHLAPGTAIEELVNLEVWVQRAPTLATRLVWIRAVFCRDRRRIRSRWRVVRLPSREAAGDLVLVDVQE